MRPFMGHQNVSVHMSHQKAFKAVPLWVIRSLYGSSDL
ncbi:hypothetical protein LOK49_LG15G00662 [Camellia lanceoleosa]|uniref:Uncharacterized protein n=1 Tax=Camellia lanceoleosa TaxID=1840588 RepID=A0ACC0F060_9ERIC|nr:hypothetical protein LOK49_LG15G00662 [Camellia lanceoleosa]